MPIEVEISIERHVPAPRLLALLCLATAGVLAAAAILADTLYLTIRFFQPVFISDAWETVRDYALFKSGAYGLSDLLAQHNEHRIAIPRLIFFADFAAGRGLNIINLAAVYIVQSLHAALLTAMAFRVSRGLVFLISASAIVILLFSFGQSDNLTFGFQVQFVGVYAAASLSFLLFADAAVGVSNESALRLSGALTSAVIATLMMSNGMLVLPVLVLLAIAARLSKLRILAIGFFAVAVILAYVHGARLGGAASPAPSQIAEVAAYALIYIGGIFGASGLIAASVLGLVGCCLASYAGLRLAFGGDRNVVRTALIGIMAFVAATTAVTAWGRVSYGLPQALESRYFTPSAVFWAAQLIYWSSFVKPPSALWPRALFTALSVLIMIGAIERHLAQRPSAKWNFMDANRASDALLSGVHPPDIMQFLYPSPNALTSRIRFLQAERLNVFALPEAKWPGAPVRHVFPQLGNRRCIGMIDKRTPIDGSDDEAIEGWAWDKSKRQLVTRLVIVGPDETIIGLGSGGWFRADFRNLPSVESAEPGWKGFAHRSKGKAIHAYAVFGSDACELQ